jgi:hypothetical protein
VLLALVTLLVYLPVRHYPFINYDDGKYVAENTAVQAGLTWTGVKWAFTSLAYVSDWHPLVWLSFMVDCQLFGMDAGWLHLINVFFHAANAVLLFLLLLRLTSALWPSAFITAVFAWHLLRVESVAWVTERKDVLFLFLGCCLCWPMFDTSTKRPVPRGRSNERNPLSHASGFLRRRIFGWRCWSLRWD